MSWAVDAVILPALWLYQIGDMICVFVLLKGVIICYDVTSVEVWMHSTFCFKSSFHKSLFSSANKLNGIQVRVLLWCFVSSAVVLEKLGELS